MIAAQDLDAAMIGVSANYTVDARRGNQLPSSVDTEAVKRRAVRTDVAQDKNSLLNFADEASAAKVEA